MIATTVLIAAGCASDEGNASGSTAAKGRMVTVTIPGTQSGFTTGPAIVYLPATYFRTPRPSLPVIMLLPGDRGGPKEWVARPDDANEAVDAYAARHGGRAPILVLPDPHGTTNVDTECVDGPQGNVETYLSQDVPRFIIARYGARSTARSWAVAGLSAGGYCAPMLALRNPRQFLTFGDYAGLNVAQYYDETAQQTVQSLFGGSQSAYDAYALDTLLAGRTLPEMGGWFEVGGNDDDPLTAIREIVPLARQAGISTCFHVVAGAEHNQTFFSRAFRDSLPWMAARIGVVRSPPRC